MGPQNWTLDPTPKTPLDHPPRNSLCTVFCWENQHLHKEFERLSPLLDPPARVPPKFFTQIFFGCFFRSWIWGAANGGLRDGGLSKSEDIWGKRPFSSVFWISHLLFGPCGKGRKRQKKGEKVRFRPISRKGDQTPLKPPFVTPPFAAAQWIGDKAIRLSSELRSKRPAGK